MVRKVANRALSTLVERCVEDRKDRNAEQRAPVQRPGAGGPLSMAAQLLTGVRAAADHDRCLSEGRFSAQPRDPAQSARLASVKANAGLCPAAG